MVNFQELHTAGQGGEGRGRDWTRIACFVSTCTAYQRDYQQARTIILREIEGSAELTVHIEQATKYPDFWEKGDVYTHIMYASCTVYVVLSVYVYVLCSSQAEKKVTQIELINDIIAPHTRSLRSHTKTDTHTMAHTHTHTHTYTYTGFITSCTLLQLQPLQRPKGKEHTKRMSSLLMPYSPSLERVAI